jgi:hypothetical protein
MNRLGLVYLLRDRNGPEPVRAFVESYRQCRGGIPHELLVLCKGFGSVQETSAYDPLWAGLAHRRMVVPDRGYDLEAYFRVLADPACSRFCFVNSFSEVLDPDWLEKLSTCLDAPGVGLVGATGSWESLYTNAVREHALGLERPFWQRALRPVRLFWLKRRFPPFPNPHVRTTAFMADRRVLERIVVPPMRFKLQALQFETGYRSVTRQVQAMDLQVRIAGRDAVSYPPDLWATSRTYRQAAQENLLVGDNRTRQYAAAAPGERSRLTRLAWGAEEHTTGAGKVG